MRLRTVVAVSLLATGLFALPASASCGVSGVRGRDPGRAALGAEIDRAAARRKVPPFLLKAVAWQESRWAQFRSDGRVVLSGACAIGVMQVLPRGWDASRLARDYRYNVDAGAQMLAAKMAASSANVPRSLGSDERRVAENWYRAAYRYNGAGYGATRYADAVFATSGNPPSEIRPWFVPVAVTNPRTVVRGYTPTSGHGYVARLDGTWASTLGTYHHAVVRGDYLAGAARTTAGRALEGDQATRVAFAARNLGWATWTRSRISLSTQPVGRGSKLRHSSWLSATRPAAVAADTVTGAEGRFEFWVKAANPASAVTVSEGFVPVVDGTVSLRARAASSWTLNPAHVPTASITSAPAYVTDASTTSAATVGLAFGDPGPGSGVAYVEVSHRAPGATAWRTTRVTSSAARLALSGAGAHAVRVRAVDRAYHASAWTSPRTIVVPRDDTDAALAFSDGWTSTPTDGSWLGTLATAPEGATVETTVDGASYALIGTRGPGLAKLSVYLDGVLVTVVDPYADTTAQRQVLWSDALVPGDHVLRIVVGDTTAPAAVEQQRAPVVPPTASLDAVAVAS
jgi:hypothetical protein